MRYLLAAFVLLFAAAWSWQDSGRQDDGLVVSSLHRVERERQTQDLLELRQAPEGQVDGDITRLLRYRVSGRRDIWSAGGLALGQDSRPRRPDGSLPDGQGGREEGASGQEAGGQDASIYNPRGTGVDEAGDSPPGGGLGDNPYLEEATAYYGVEWARDALVLVRFRESSNTVEPCVIGDSGERGPYQFMAGTWRGTPYADLDPCDLEVATWAAAWFVAEGRWLEWTTWPR